MKRTYFTYVVLFVFGCILNAQTAKQSFDGSDDNWSFTSNIPFYSNNNGTDIWRKQNKGNGRISGPFKGASFLAGRDLDNEYSEAYTGLSSPEHILTFETVNLNNLTAELSFRVQYVGVDKGDYIYYQLRYDNEADWDYSDYTFPVFQTNQNGNFNSRGWQEVYYKIPSGHKFARMRLVIYQNGNEYLGFDDFELKTATLSSKYTSIEGFSFGPNPTTNKLNLSASTPINKITVYDVLGKQVFTKYNHANTWSISVESLHSGMYLAKIEAGSSIETIKFFKK